MTTTDQAQAPVTIATATYEASSMLALFDYLPAPVYVTVITHQNGTAAVGLQFGTPAAVTALATDPLIAHLITKHLTTTDCPAGKGYRAHTTTRVEFTIPFNDRITVDAYSLDYADEAAQS